MLNKVEVDILKLLFKEGLIDPMNSRTVTNISKGIGLNNLRVRNNLSHLCQLGFVKNGYKERQSKTYFISEIGINEIKEI
jgi:predicted transcriptional regulator